MSRDPVDEVAIAAATGEMVAAFFSNGGPVRLAFGGHARERRLGEISLGRVRRVERDLDAVFVDIGDTFGFLNRGDLGGTHARRGFPGEGDPVLVQVSREAAAGKAAKLTGAVVLPGRTLIYRPGRDALGISRRIIDGAQRERLRDLAATLPRHGGGWFIRHAAVVAQPDTILAEARTLFEQWQRLEDRARSAAPPVRLYRPPDPVLAAIAEEAGPSLKRIRADDPGVLAAIRTHLPDLAPVCRLDLDLEPMAVEAAIEAALAPTVALAGGGAIHFAETPALVAIDVDAGSRHAGGGEQTALAVNLEAVRAIALHLGLRDLSGHLVIDFVGMRRRVHRERLVNALLAAFAEDPLETQVAGYTRLGKVELTRRRVRASARERLSACCPVCDGSGSVLASAHAAHACLRAALHAGRSDAFGSSLTIVAAPDVATALAGTVADGRSLVERRLGRRLGLREDPGLAASCYRLELTGTVPP